MALTSQGPDVALQRTAGGKFDWKVSRSGPNKGNPEMSADRTHAVISTVFSWKRGRRPGDKSESGGYYWDESGARGTRLWTVVQDTSSTRSKLLACTEDAKQQLVEGRYITDLQADAQRLGLGLGRWAATIGWRTPQGDRKEALRL